VIDKDYASFCGVTINGVSMNDFPTSMCFGDNCVQSISIRGVVKNGTNNNLIPQQTLVSDNIKVVFTSVTTSVSYTASLKEGSTYEIKLPPGIYKRVATLDGFSESSREIQITVTSDESNLANAILFVPAIVGWNAILTWNDAVQDLDIISVSSSGQIVNYNKKVSDDQKVSLDVDSRKGWGPETLSFKGVQEGKYTIYVNNYSNEKPLSASNAKVILYRDGKTVADVKIPQDAQDRYWKVYEIDASSNSFQTINTVHDSITQ